MGNVVIDWGNAAQIGGIGFGVTFIVLIILALAIWLVGYVVRKSGIGNGTAEKKKVD